MDTNTFLSCEAIAARYGLCVFYRESREGRMIVVHSDEIGYYGRFGFVPLPDVRLTKRISKQIVHNLCAVWWDDQKHRNEIERRRSKH